MQLKAWPVVLAVFGVAMATVLHRAAVGTPIYAARAGRTCDNCHVTPNQWKDPSLADRKCSLACQTCHVDPAGGGMRNVSGRYYGQATLPMIATSPRPTNDWDINFPGFGRRDRATTYNDNLATGPAAFDNVAVYADSIADGWAWGVPAGAPTARGPFQGRHGTLNSDPLFRVAVDLRVAALLGSTPLAFPMQVDVPVLLHPVHHFTLFVNTGFRGQSSGYSDTFDDSHSPYFREAFALAHELPYQAYAKAGRFVPAYGLRLDDHTSRIRREYELDGALPESRVTGIEVGAAPNYPFVNMSWFKMASRTRTPDPWDIFDSDQGWGAAVNAGFRELGWTIGTSALVRRRPLEEGGDTSTYGLYGVINPWFYARGVPLTLQGEVDFGRFQRLSGIEATRNTIYAELDWLIFNGWNALLAYDFADPDHDIRDDESSRITTGLQVTVYPGVTLDGRIRALVPAGGNGAGADFFVQLHIWN